MRLRAAVPAGTGVLLALLTVAGCTSDATGDSTPTATATATVTTTASGTGATGAPVTGSAGTTPTGSGKTVGAGGGSASASGPGLCTPTVMTLAVGRDEGAAGTSYFSVVATNASQQSCVTTGFPGVALLNASGQQILQATRDTSSPSATITLAPGEQATAVVAASASGDGSTVCPSSPALLFTLPDNTDSTKLTHTTPACAVTVRAFVKGAG